MAVQTKGGVPRTIRATISNAPADADAAKRVAPARTIHLRIVNTDGANDLRIYWTAEDLDAANSNFVTIASGGIWSEPAEIVSFFPLAVTAPIIAEITYFARR